MADTLLKLNPGTLPEGYCWPSNPQEFNALIFSLAHAIFPGELTTFNFGNSTPTADNRDKPWIRTDASGNFDAVYTWGGGGVWVSPYLCPASGDERRLWVGLEADLKTYDGGVDEPVSDTTGPFWEVDHDFDAKFPVGPGTFPAGAVVGVGDTGGVDQITLGTTNLPPHTHYLGTESAGSIESDDLAGNLRSSGSNYFTTAENTTHVAQTRSAGGGGSPAAAVPVDTVPPYRGVFFIARTARIYKTA